MTEREHEELLATATDRFERRLSEEAASLREGDSAIRLEIANLRSDLSEQGSAIRLELANLRSDLSEQDSAIRLEIANLRSDTRLEIAGLRVDMSEQFASSRIHTEARHREMLKWTIVLWLGQAAAVAGIVSALT